MKLYVNLMTAEFSNEPPADEIFVPEPVMRVVRRVSEGMGATVARGTAGLH